MAVGHTGRHRHRVKGRGTFQEKSISQAPQSRWTPGWCCLSKLNEGSGGKKGENGSQWMCDANKNIPLVFHRAGIHTICLAKTRGARRLFVLFHVFLKKDLHHSSLERNRMTKVNDFNRRIQEPHQRNEYNRSMSVLER